MGWLLTGVLIVNGLMLYCLAHMSNQIEALAQIMAGAANEAASGNQTLREIEHHGARQTRKLDDERNRERELDRELNYP